MKSFEKQRAKLQGEQIGCRKRLDGYLSCQQRLTLAVV